MTPSTVETPIIVPALPRPSRELEPPLRGELLSLERSVDAVRSLAAAQDVSFAPSTGSTPLPRLLKEADTQIREVVAALAAEVRAKRAVSPATEWLLDNSYLVDEQVRDARSNLPSAFGRKLPHLLSGPRAGYPRVYELAVLLVENTDSRLEHDYLQQAAAAYQEIAPLNTGELWAVPIMLRIALVENARRLALRVLAAHQDEVEADDWADALTAASEIDDARVAADRLAAKLIGGDTSPSVGFLVRLEQRLQGQDIAVASVHDWAARSLRESGGGSVSAPAP